MTTTTNMKKFSSIQEHRVADYLNWSVVSGSGARQFDKGDVVSDQFLGECKTHVEKYQKIIFYYSHWKKIVEEASSKFKSPVLIVDDGSQSPKNTWCMFNASIGLAWNRFELSQVCPFRTNIIFETSQMKRFLTLLNSDKSYYDRFYLAARFGDYDVGVLDLETFALLFN